MPGPVPEKSTTQIYQYMGPKPFNLEQAKGIVSDFNHLVGTEYNDTDAAIHFVAVAPFDKENKDIFLDNYRSVGRITEDSLVGYYGPFYDVIVIAHSKGNMKKIIEENIISFARNNNIDYVFPEYPFQ